MSKNLWALLLSLSLVQSPFALDSAHARIGISLEEITGKIQYRNQDEAFFDEDEKDEDDRVKDSAYEYRIKARIKIGLNENFSIYADVQSRPKKGVAREGNWVNEHGKDFSMALTSAWVRWHTEKMDFDFGAFQAAMEKSTGSDLAMNDRYTIHGLRVHLKELSKRNINVEVKAGNLDINRDLSLFDVEDITEQDMNYAELTISGEIAQGIMLEAGLISYEEIEQFDKRGNPVARDPNLLPAGETNNYWKAGVAIPLMGFLFKDKQHKVKAQFKANVIGRFNDYERTVYDAEGNPVRENGANKVEEVENIAAYKFGVDVQVGKKFNASLSYVHLNRKDALSKLYEDVENGMSIALQGINKKTGQSDEGIILAQISYEVICGVKVYAFGGFSDEDTYGGGIEVNLLKLMVPAYKKECEDRGTQNERQQY